MIKCIEIGEREYAEFKKDRLQEKSVKLFDSIHNVKFNVASKHNASQQHLDLKKETLKFMRVIEIARLRGYDLAALLQHEITTTSFFLAKDDNLKKSPKSEFGREMKSSLDEIQKQFLRMIYLQPSSSISWLFAEKYQSKN